MIELRRSGSSDKEKPVKHQRKKRKKKGNTETGMEEGERKPRPPIFVCAEPFQGAARIREGKLFTKLPLKN